MRSIANDRSMVVKEGDRGSCTVVWDPNNSAAEAEK